MIFYNYIEDIIILLELKEFIEETNEFRYVIDYGYHSFIGRTTAPILPIDDSEACYIDEL